MCLSRLTDRRQTVVWRWRAAAPDPFPYDSDTVAATAPATTYATASRTESKTLTAALSATKRKYQTATVVAAAGALETGVLTVVKLLQSDVTCATRGCGDVLRSPFASLFGVPLTFFGAVAYSLVAYLAYQAWSECSRSGVEALHTDTSPPGMRLHGGRIRIQGLDYNEALLGVTAFMAVFSSYLIGLLVFELRAVCPWCILSAVCSVALFTLSLRLSGHIVATASADGHTEDTLAAQAERQLRQRRRRRRASCILGISAVLAMAGSASSYAAAHWSMHQAAVTHNVPASQLQRPPPIQSHSTPEAMALAQHLRRIGAKMYGAYWCEHCREQREMFGREAYDLIEYVECSKYGVNGRMDLCRKRHVPGYPTWEVGGRLYPGEHSLEELADISRYQRSGREAE